MKISILAASTLFFTLAQSAPVTIDPVTGPTDRHIIRHSHKLNCLNCFCGHKAIERARHACPADRDLILCPTSIPVRACYRCACYQRVPVSPSPPVMKPHSEDDHDEADHEDDHDEVDDMMMETPDSEDGMDSMSSTPMPTMKPHPMDMKKKPRSTMMPKATYMPHATTKPESTKKPHPTKTTKHAKKTQTNTMSMPTKKPHPTITTTPTKKAHPTSSPSKKPHPTNQSGTQTPKASPNACASFQRGGGGGNTMFDVDLLEDQGTFKVSWQMDTVPDMIEIIYEDKKIFTTKVPVSGHGSAYVKYSGMSTKIRVWVTSPTSGTGWFLTIGCTKDDH